MPVNEKKMKEDLSELKKEVEINVQKYLQEIFKDLKIEKSKKTSFGEVLFEFYKKEVPLKEDNKIEIKKQHGDVFVNVLVGYSTEYIGSKITRWEVIIQFWIDNVNNNLSISKVEYKNFQEVLRYNYGSYLFKDNQHLKEMINKIDFHDLREISNG